VCPLFKTLAASGFSSAKHFVRNLALLMRPRSRIDRIVPDDPVGPQRRGKSSKHDDGKAVQGPW